ncbi:TetR family transcriptional regulator, partial [Streptomyces sp. SID5914]
MCKYGKSLAHRGADVTIRPALRGPRGRATRATRARILEAARQELGRDPDSSLGDIAEAAGVARRTVYSHFAGRAALIEGLVEDASATLRSTIADAALRDPDAATALARFFLILWPVADRYRMLLRLAAPDLPHEQVNGVLAPARDMVTDILSRGRRQGVFSTPVPPAALSRALEAHHLALLERVN